MRDLHPKFMPQWTQVVRKYIKNSDFDDCEDKVHNCASKKGLNIVNTSHCLVGEAHHFNNDYTNGCATCDCEAYNIFDVLRKKKLSEFYKWKHKMFVHFQKRHPMRLPL